jgi:hypothetical protein
MRVEAYGKQTGLPNILQIMESERPDQYRGVTYLAPVIEPLLQLRRYTESELMAALVQSFFSAWIKTTTDPTQLPLNEVGDGGDDDEVSQNENEYEMGPGTVTHLQEGEEIVFGNPNIPTAGFGNFLDAMLTPDCILCDDTEVGTDNDVNVAVYTAGCFNPQKVTVNDGYTITEANKDELRKRDIVFNAASEAR